MCVYLMNNPFPKPKKSFLFLFSCACVYVCFHVCTQVCIHDHVCVCMSSPLFTMFTETRSLNWTQNQLLRIVCLTSLLKRSESEWLVLVIHLIFLPIYNSPADRFSWSVSLLFNGFHLDTWYIWPFENSACLENPDSSPL